MSYVDNIGWLKGVENHAVVTKMDASLHFGGFVLMAYQFCDATPCFSQLA